MPWTSCAVVATLSVVLSVGTFRSKGEFRMKEPGKQKDSIALAGMFQIFHDGNILASNFTFDPPDMPEPFRRRLVLDYALMAIDNAINDAKRPVRFSGDITAGDIDERGKKVTARKEKSCPNEPPMKSEAGN